MKRLTPFDTRNSLFISPNWVYFLIGGFIFGVLWRSFFTLGGDVSNLAFSVFITMMSVVSVILYGVYRTRTHFFVGLVILGMAFGVVRFDIAEWGNGDPYLETQVGEVVNLTGVVVGEPSHRETNTKLVIQLTEADNKYVDTKILVTTFRYPAYSYGSELRFTGELQKPSVFEGEDGRLFDYEAYLKKDGIFYTMFFPSVELLRTKQGSVVKQALFDVKDAFLLRVGRVIEEPQASLLGGLVVGAKQSLGEALLEKFRRAGIIHIVVLSGYNVTIVAEFIMRILSHLPVLLARSLGIGSIILFAIMTGAGATIVRASIMAVLVILARGTGRTYKITRALIIAGFFMIIQNPRILVFDTSFQLSFMATVGLIYLAPRLEAYFGWVPTKWQLREFATATIATQLFVLPLLLYKMGEFSIVALPVNMLVLPAVAPTMLLGFLTGVAGFLSIVFSLPFAFATTALLSYQLFVVDIFAGLPFAAVSVSSFSLSMAIGAYALYFIGLAMLHRHPLRETIQSGV